MFTNMFTEILGIVFMILKHVDIIILSIERFLDPKRF